MNAYIGLSSWGLFLPIQHAVFCPPVDSDIDGMPGTEGFRKGPPFTAVLADSDDGIKEPAVIDFYISVILHEEWQKEESR
jgi:hypothetical protein